jgi:hypothetical protein
VELERVSPLSRSGERTYLLRIGPYAVDLPVSFRVENVLLSTGRECVLERDEADLTVG